LGRVDDAKEIIKKSICIASIKPVYFFSFQEVQLLNQEHSSCTGIPAALSFRNKHLIKH
jgi:hypothetical protein